MMVIWIRHPVFNWIGMSLLSIAWSESYQLYQVPDQLVTDQLVHSPHGEQSESESHPETIVAPPSHHQSLNSLHPNLIIADTIQTLPNRIQAALTECPLVSKYMDNIQFEFSETGLDLMIKGYPNQHPQIFEDGSARVNSTLTEILKIIAYELRQLKNRLILLSYTDAAPLKNACCKSTNLGLSQKRAKTARLVLERFGVKPTQFKKVEGKGTNSPLDPNHPCSLENRRLVIRILYENQQIIPDHSQHKLTKIGR